MTDQLPTEPEALAAWLRELEARSGISRGEIGRLTGSDRKTVRRWLEGTTEPSGSKLLLLLNALGVEWAYEPAGLPRAVNVELAALREELARVRADTLAQVEALVQRLGQGDPPGLPASQPPSRARSAASARR